MDFGYWQVGEMCVEVVGDLFQLVWCKFLLGFDYLVLYFVVGKYQDCQYLVFVQSYEIDLVEGELFVSWCVDYVDEVVYC